MRDALVDRERAVRKLRVAMGHHRMKKPECEKIIRRLCHDWPGSRDASGAQVEQPSFSAFKAWLKANGHSRYLDFRSVMGPEYDAEIWFDKEFKQMSRR